MSAIWQTLEYIVFGRRHTLNARILDSFITYKINMQVMNSGNEEFCKR